MFMCEYNHTLDTKGRLIVPTKFRETLGEEFVACKGLDHCLYLYSMEDWEAFEKQLSALPLTSSKARKFVRFFASGSSVVEVDKQGRILLPPSLRTYAGLEKDVVLAGALHRVEIWDKDSWYNGGVDDDVDEIAESMDEFGIVLTQ